jgi:hypothetical protein
MKPKSISRSAMAQEIAAAIRRDDTPQEGEQR